MLVSVQCLPIILKTLHSILGGGREKKGDRVRGEKKSLRKFPQRQNNVSQERGEREWEKEKRKVKNRISESLGFKLQEI